MIFPRTPVSRGPVSREIPSRILSCLHLFAFLFIAAATSAVAQYRTYPIYTDVSSVPAGSHGTTIVASVNDSSATANFNVCFDTGYGSSKVPIVPYNYVSYGDFAQFNFDVPPSTIQAVPPGAFTSGSFNVSIYSVPPNFTACNGNEPGAAQGNTVTLNYPVLNSVSLPYIPEQNTALTAREPSTLDLSGSNFISNSGTSGDVPSAVNFISSTTLAGTVKFLAGYLLRSTIPTTIPAGASSVNIQVCNTATYSYCSNSLTLKTVALQQDPGTLTATPSPAFTTQPVTLTATFGPAKPSTAGAPSGPVGFGFGPWGANLGTANLVLDKTATFVQAPTQQFLVYATPIPPIVADFNGDGIPDTLFIDPGSANYNATLHLQLGTVPAGSFQADQQFYVQSDGPGFTISSAAVGDFNGDGIPDIILLATEPGYNSGLNLYTMLGNGDGTFQDGFGSSPTLYGSQIVAGDFNKDGKLDIAIAGALDANGTIGLQTLLGDGTGNFTAGPSTTGLRTAPSPYFGDFKVAAADFNGDGYPDIAVMNGYSPQGQLDNSIEVYQNDGTGAFLAPVRVQTDGTATANFSIAALGPGKPLDIIVTSTASQYPGIDVALNQSTKAKIAFFGTFQGTEVPGFNQAVFGDFDGDGLLDAAVDDGKTIHVLSGDGLGAFTAIYTGLSIVPPGTTLIAASDENGDKYADLLLYTTGGQNDSGQYPVTLFDYVTAGTATATYPPTTFAAGTQTIHASTNGTFNILAGTARATLVVTTPPASTVTLSAAPASPTSFGTALVTLTAAIPVTNATGSVAFYNGTTFLGNAPLVDAASSTATFALSAPAAGSYSFMAVYAGDTTHGAGTSAVLPYVVNPATSVIHWTPNPSTIVYGTPLTAAQLDASATGIAGANLPGTFAYTPGLGTVLAAGAQPLCVTFTPTDANYAPANTCQTINVTQVRPSVAFTITSGGKAASSVASGGVVTLTATVTVAGKPVTPGQVNFCDATAAYCTDIHLLGTAQLTSSGTATLRFVPGIGSHNYQAVFLGTGNDAGSLSEPAALTVTGLYPTATTIAQSGSVGNYTLTATTVGTGTLSAAPTGTVSFLDSNNGNAVLANAQLGPAVSSETFVNASTPAAASNPIFVVSADINRDGTIDIITTNRYTNSLTVLLGNGDGTFTAAASPNVGSYPDYIALGDFNGDGKVDLAVTNFYSGTITILLGNGDGTFTPAAASPATGADPRCLVAADFNGDGILDLAVGKDSAIAIFLGNGDGTFLAAASPASGSGPNYGIAAGDFDGDGKIDLATTNFAGNTVSVLLGNGDGTFTSVSSPATGSGPESVAVGDFNGDGILDIAVTNQYSQLLTILLGNGDGTFTAAASPTAGNFPRAAAVGDFNRDGKADLAVVNQNDNTASVLLGNGDGTFTSLPAVATGRAPAWVAAGDFNNDGLADFATANITDDNVSVLVSQIGQTSTAVAQGVSPLGAGTHEVVASYPGDANFGSSASAPMGLMGATIAPVIRWTPTPATIPYGTALAASQLDATATTATGATIPGTFTYTPAAGAILTAGTQILKLVFTPASSIYSVATAQTTITVTQATPAITWLPNPAAITYGTPLSAAQLDATASTPGTFVYTPALGAILAVGTQTLNVAFTPTDAVDFTSASKSVTISVLPSGVTLNPASLQFGNVPYGTSVTQVVTVTNPGTLAITGIGVSSTEYPNPNDFIPTQNCPASLAPGATCQISVTFVPDGVGTKSGSINVFGSSFGSEIPVSGTGAGGVLQVNPGNLKTIAGNGTSGYSGDGGPATAAQLNTPNGIVFDSQGNLYIADQYANVVRKVDTSGNISTFAGTGTAGYSGDGGPAVKAELNFPLTVAVDGKGNIYIQDTGNNVIRKVDASGTITTSAGTGSPGDSGDGGPAIDATFFENNGARFDSAGNFFVPQCVDSSVRKIDTTGTISTVAGNFTNGYSGDGGPAVSAQLACPSGVTIDPAGNFYIADYYNNVIRKVDTKGIITTIAGDGTPGANGDGGPASAARLSLPDDVVLDPAGNLYIADEGNNRVRKIDTSGIITTVAGGLNDAGSAGVNAPLAVTLDKAGGVYFTDSGNSIVREIYPQGIAPFPDTPIGATAPAQTVTLSNIGNVPIVIPASGAFTLSGNASDFSLSGGTCLNGATLAVNEGTCTLQISFTPTAAGPRSLTVSIADNALNSPQSFTIGGNGTAVPATLTWPAPASIVYGTPLSATQLDAAAAGLGGTAVSGTYTYMPAAGTILSAGTHTLAVVFTSTDPNYTSATASVPITVTQAAPVITWLPNPATITYGTPLSAAQLDAASSTPGTFTYTPALGTVLTAGSQTLSVAFTPADPVDFTAATKTVSITVDPGGLMLSAASIQFGNQPYGTTSPAQTVTVTNPGTLTINIYNVISQAPPNPLDFLPTGNCITALLPGASCQINVTFKPDGVGVKAGYIDIIDDAYISEQSIAVSGTGTGGILQVNPGNLKTIAGNGVQGYTGDEGPATAAELNEPDGVAFDALGDLFIADTNNNVVRKVDTSGKITTVAGTGTAGYSGDGGPATAAELARPYSVIADTAGNLYIQDTGNAVIRKVGLDGVITTFAGNGTFGDSGDGGPATAAEFDGNQGARFDSAGNFFVPQCELPAIRRIDTKGIINTVAGNFTTGYSGDGGPATSAQLACPSGVAIDAAGNFYIADYYNHAIRKVDTKGTITTIAGNGTPGAAGDGGPATAATLNLPNDVVLDAAGNLYIAESGSNRIRKIDTNGIITTVAGGLASAGSAEVNTPSAVALDPSGNLYFSDTNNNAVRELLPQGTTPFPATIIGNTATPETLTLSNVGNVPIVIPASGAFTLGGNASDFSLIGGTCLNGATLAVNEGTCSLQISFTPTAAGPRTLIVSIADNALNAPQSFTIGGIGSAAAPTLTWTPPAAITYGTPLSAAQLDAAAAGLGGTAVSGTYTYTPAAGAVLTAGTHTLSVVFTSTDPNYTGATATVPITVGQAVPSVAWTPSPSTIGYGTPLSTAQLDATSTTPGSFTYTPAAGTVLTAGTQTLSAVFTPTDAIDFASVTKTATIIVTSATPAVTWLPNPAAITYGMPLSAAQLDASSTTPGTFAYTPPLGTLLSAGPQILAALFTPTDTTDFKSVTATAAIAVSQAKPTLSWTTPAPIVSGTPLSAAQLNATAIGVNGLPLSGVFTYTPAAGTLLPIGTSTLSVLFTPTDSIDYTTAAATVVQSVTAPPTATTLNISPAQSVFGQPVTFTAVTTSTAPVTGTVNFYDGSNLLGSSSVSPASPATLTRATLAAAHHTITAVYIGDQNFLPSTSNAVSLAVSPAPTAIAWTPSPATITYGSPLTAAQLDATVSTAYTPAVAGTFVYTPALNSVLPPGPQTLQVSFTPTDATDFLPSTGTAQVTVTQAVPVITWAPAPATITYGTPLSAAQLDAASAIPGTFTYSSALGTILTAGTQTLSVLFTPADTVHYKSVTATAAITVTPATPAVTWMPNPATISYGTALSTAQLDAASATPGTFTYTPALGTILTAGTQTLTAVFKPTDTVDFKSVSTTATISVTAAAPVITWTPNPATISYGTALSAAQLDATSAVAGTFTYTPALGTVLAAGTQTLSAVFKPTDATDFKSVTVTATIVVSPAAPVISWTPNPATITYGTALTAAQLDANSNTPGTFTYTPALGTVLTAGTQTLSATFTPSDAADFKSVSATATITVTAATPSVTWTPNPATITYGAALTAAQLDAVSSTPGTFSYNPPLGTILTAGTQTLSALFTPTDSKDFKSVTITATITVTAATPAVTWTPNPASITYGAALSAGQLDASSATPGTFSYNPPLGTVLSAGTQTLSALFTPADARNFKSVTATATITVGQAAPTITWATPASIVVGTALSSTQLNAAATGVTGAALSGTFTYTPAAGTILAVGTQTINVVFTPSDLADYTTAAASVTLQVIPVTLTALSTTTAALGDPAKTITLTGTGFVPTASVLVNGTAIPTTFVNGTTLTAVIPASDFLTAQTLQISVTEPSQNQTTSSLPFLVGAPPANAVFTGPSIAPSGTQTGLTFQLPDPYPVDLTSTFKLSFTPAAGLPDDPTVVFASGGTTFVATIPANSTTVPPVMIQSGTVAGTIAIGLTLDAGGINVTPASIKPLNIQAPLAVPGIASVTFTTSGSTLTVTVHGFSNARDMTSAKFHFTPVTGASITNEDVTIDVGSLFTTWYADPASIQYGSSFTYAQTFNLSSDASVVGQVSVTLANSVGVSPEAKTP